ncbi:MAG: 50S ribosomal protein L29 [Candidatus Pacebacteria bacterium]|mgnify:FL=1|nr:50S ribosomal protein L29 [Candidatus Paceibacterota bacterium]
MAKKKEQFKGMKKEEIQKEVLALREKIRLIRFKAEGSKSKNLKEDLALRKQVARGLTIINQK